MIIDAGGVAQGRIPDAAYSPHARAQKAWRKRILNARSLLVIWAVASAVWITGAIYDIYQRVDEQADMSVDVEHDLDQGLSPANCKAPCLAALQGSATSNRLDIASTYLQFGSIEMGECVLGPPVAFLLVGLGAFSALRRRRQT